MTWKYPSCDLCLTLTDAQDHVISRYLRHLRCVPKQLLDQRMRERLDDWFNRETE